MTVFGKKAQELEYCTVHLLMIMLLMVGDMSLAPNPGGLWQVLEMHLLHKEQLPFTEYEPGARNGPSHFLRLL